MFGYVMANRPELKVREYERYRGFYCGLCRELGRVGGQHARLTLTYDMTFLILLLTGLYEPENEEKEGGCVLHPLEKHRMISNEFTRYGADMNLLLAYYNGKDRWKDEKKVAGLAAMAGCAGAVRRIEKEYPRQAEAVRKELEELDRIENGKSAGIDEAAACTGRLLGEIFVYREDVWSETLRRMGFFLGKFVYLCDAWEDLSHDKEKGLYNPFEALSARPDYEDCCLEILNTTMGECARCFERLPILQDAEIMRNILYSGVWVRYGAVKNAGKEGKEKA